MSIKGNVYAYKKYGIVVDAGSSGSRIHLYTWEARQSKDELPVIEEPKKLTKLKGGISLYKDNPSEAYKTVKTLIETLYKESDFTKELEKDTPFFLFATAGMRMLPQATSTEIMNSIRSYIKKNTDFICDDDHVEVIPGNYEAIYGWLQLNYAMGRFQNGSTTYGAMDLGGASTQITYELPGSFQTYGNGMEVRVGGKDYRLFATSYLRYGLTEAINLNIEEFLERHAKETGPFDFPCYNTGYNHSFTNHILRGTSHPENCSKIVRSMLHLTDFCPEKQQALCGIAGQYQPDISKNEMKLYAFSAFANIAKGVRLINEHEAFSSKTYLQQIAQKQQEYCSYNWEDLQKHADTGKAYMNTICFGITYMHELYKEAYKFQESYQQVDVVFTIPGSTIEAGWALGALIYELSITDVKIYAIILPAWINSFVLYSFVILTLFLIVVCTLTVTFCCFCNSILYCRRSKHSKKRSDNYRSFA